MRTVRSIAGRPRVALLLLVVAAFALSFALGCASAQPHMQSALDHLSSARSELQQALANKGGHRERALELIDQAINQVEMGINFARNR
jgi:hypothetical protein